MFTTIPEDLGSLSVDELRGLRSKVKGEVRKALAEDRSPETVKAGKDAIEGCNRIEGEIQARALQAAAEDDDDEPELAKKKAADEPAEDDSGVDGNAPDNDAEREAKRAGDPGGAAKATAEENADDDKEASDKVPAVPARTPKVRTGVGVDAKPESAADGGKRITPDKVLAGEGVKGHEVGSAFANWGEVAAGIVDKAANLRSNADGKYEVAFVPATGPRIMLDEDQYKNLHLFDDDNELKAALCTAPEPAYDMACWNTDRRPVFNSLVTYQPSARGSVSIYPSPTLQDITGGYGQWTFNDDDDAEAEKECATIECGTPETYEWYAIYRCLTIKHSMLMTFPELVEAWLNRLAAATARYAETLMLEAMATSADTLQMPTLGYNASTSVTTGLLNYLALYQEQQRWDVPQMDAWLHRWWLYAAKADMMRRRTTSGRISVPSDAEVTALFRENGIEPHFFIDNPSWATDIPNLQTTGRLGQFPRNLEVLVAPRGKFAKFDRGRLSIGVTGNNLYRDTGNLRRNEITFFVESYEGTVDTNSCPAHLLQFNNLCYNGQQIADLVINCEGGDEVGAAS
jgi:hypothetical protein